QIISVIEHQLKNAGEVSTLPDLSSQTSKLVTSAHSTLSRFSLDPAQKPKPRQRKAPRWPLAAGLMVVGLGLGAGLAWLAGAGEGWVGRSGERRSSQAANAAAVPAATARAVRGVTDHEILMGMSAAFSGPSQELGNRMKLGIETGFAQVNEAGGVAGRKLRLV